MIVHRHRHPLNMASDPKNDSSSHPPEDSKAPLHDRLPADASGNEAPHISPEAGPSTPPRQRLPVYQAERPSSIPTFLKRVVFVVSLVLGAGAVGSFLFDRFFLPLVHSSLSARKALVDQQKDRFESLLHGLRALKSTRRHQYHPMEMSYDLSQSTNLTSVSDTDSGATTNTKEEKHLMVEEILGDDASSSVSAPTLHPIHSDEVSPLSSRLRELSQAMDATSTTRTSLLSTLESYTSQLHEEIYLRRPTVTKRTDKFVNMGTLDANLRKEMHAQSKPVVKLAADQGEEWDSARKEVRAIKGMLLGRRNFTFNMGVDPEAAR